jgi:hypothetical protein
MLALSIRQPFAELILRGIKTVEYRSRPTRVIGRRFFIYASKAAAAKAVWSRDLAAPGEALPPWMIELAEQVGMIEPGTFALLPRGVIVGSAVIEKCVQLKHPHPNPLPGGEGMYAWHLADVERAKTLRKPKGCPQPVWFNPF